MTRSQLAAGGLTDGTFERIASEWGDQLSVTSPLPPMFERIASEWGDQLSVTSPLSPMFERIASEWVDQLSVTSPLSPMFERIASEWGDQLSVTSPVLSRLPDTAAGVIQQPPNSQPGMDPPLAQMPAVVVAWVATVVAVSMLLLVLSVAVPGRQAFVGALDAIDSLILLIGVVGALDQSSAHFHGALLGAGLAWSLWKRNR